MTLDDLIDAAASRFEFRRQLRRETAAAYRHALISHVEARDFAAANEIRLGKLQAEWTPDEVQAFKAHVLQIPRVRQEFMPGTEPIAHPVVLVPPGTAPVTEELLLSLATNGFEAIVKRRTHDPEWQVPILISALLLDGSLVATSSARGDRVAVLKYLARNSPMFGYFIAADMYLHKISDTVASRLDGIVMHIGTRDRRLVRIATYEHTPAGIVFAPPYDITPDANTEDPYAEVFVSVPPPPAGPPM